jgi:cellulose synthase/poly-beta-1,6-N-acetylglucosamine synthase-like glycosyltransferase
VDEVPEPSSLETTRTESGFPFVSVIVPCRNESAFIEGCIRSVQACDYPPSRFEIIVVDGTSSDGSRELVQRLASNQPSLRLLENPRRTMPTGVNLGIAHAKGEIVMILGAHAVVPEDYISKCVENLYGHSADNVGGIVKTLPKRDGLVAEMIISSLNHRFGVGNSYFRVDPGRLRWVDTVFGGCYRREVFDRIGLFNESLTRNQDIEFNRRLRQAGGKILCNPEIVSYYYARSDWKSFWRHSFEDGLWVILSALYSEILPFSRRHLVPLIFVTSLLVSFLVGLVAKPFFVMFLAIAGAYMLANLAASLDIAFRKRDLRFLLVMPVVFGALHFAYGLGSMYGLVRVFHPRPAIAHA